MMTIDSVFLLHITRESLQYLNDCNFLFFYENYVVLYW